MAKAFRLAYTPNGNGARPPKPAWLINCEATNRSKISTAYWTKIYWATPPWLSDDQIDEMRKLYRAAGTNHVDHIVPLKSPIVCGLHVPWNLQVMDAKSNYAKSNHWWPNHPNETLPLFGGSEPHQLGLGL